MNQYKAITIVTEKLLDLVGRHMYRRDYRDTPQTVTCLRCEFGPPNFPRGQFWTDFSQMLDHFGINSSEFMEKLMGGGSPTSDVCEPYWIRGQYSQWSGVGYRIVCCLPEGTDLEKIKEVKV